MHCLLKRHLRKDSSAFTCHAKRSDYRFVDQRYDTEISQDVVEEFEVHAPWVRSQWWRTPPRELRPCHRRVAPGNTTVALRITAGDIGDTSVTLRLGTTRLRLPVTVGSQTPGRESGVISQAIGVSVLALGALPEVTLSQIGERVLLLSVFAQPRAFDTVLQVSSVDPTLVSAPTQVVVVAGQTHGDAPYFGADNSWFALRSERYQ
ncbi:MAG: hypothetical protein ACI8PT_002485 [Gammaproteobacteria bacterium]